MCARIFYLLMACLFAFVVLTVAAFVYLEWWQAILASGAVFLFIIVGLKYLFRHIVGNIGEMAKGMVDQKSRVLRNATADVHSVRGSAPPEEFSRMVDDPDVDDYDRAEAAADLTNLNWYEVEVTIIPDAAQAGAMVHWDLDDLRLVAADTPPPQMFGQNEGDEPTDFGLYDLRVIEDGEAVLPEDTKPSGLRRLRFTVGLPSSVRAAKFQYYFEQFGRINLPNRPAIPGRR